MRRELMEILACPDCKSDLELRVEKEDGEEILEGELDCGVCAYSFPIKDGIPNLLPRELQEQG